MKTFLTISFLWTLTSLTFFGQTLTTFSSADGLINDNVHSISRGSGTSLWFGTQNGVSFYDGATFSDSVTLDDGLVHESVFAVLEDTDGNLWMGTDFGLSKFNGQDCTTYTTEDGLEDNRIKHLYQDNSGLIWIAHNDGVSSFNGQGFTNYTMNDGLPFGGVTHSTQDNEGNMWFATGLGGAFQFDGTVFTGFGIEQGLPHLSVRSIAVDASNQKWIGTNEGIVVFGSDNIVVIEHPSLIALPEPHEINPVEDIKIDLAGRVWTGIYVDYLVTVGGVAYHNGANWIDYTPADGLAGPNVKQLAVDGSGDIWAATSTGVTRFSETPLTLPMEEQASIQIYPNPAKDALYATVPENTPLKSARLMLLDNRGRTIVDRPLESHNPMICTSSFKTGVYLLQIQTEGSRFSRRVMIGD